MTRFQSSAIEEIKQALENGEVSLQGQFLFGSNYTFLVTVKYAGQEVPAVYKPMRGEQSLWDFPAASLAGREVAAYLVSEALGFGFVPLTILRDGPFGPGSLQQYIEHNPNLHYFTFKPADRQRLRPAALFDLLVNNADRKGGHILLQKRTRKLTLIDHGLCFHAEDKLRTVIWDFAGEDMPPELISALETFRSLLHLSLSADLQPYLTPEEIAALNARTEALLASPVFPLPPEDRRSFPYPPV
ncbi:MAG: SCO1664 family protein [Anaerolineales bacterium]